MRLLQIAAEMEGSTPDRICTCDVCGVQTIVGCDGERCMACIPAGDGFALCTGTYRAEPVTDRVGNDFGVSLAKLAAEQAIRDFLAEDPDNDDEITADWPDIASTYRGRSR